jgi:YVTN family beta-propeller protein
MRISKVFVLLAVLAFSFSACDNEDEKPKGKFQTGVFVVNEGNYTEADGSVSFYNVSTKETTQDLFGSINSGRALGDVVQSMTIDGDNAYIVVNNSNKVEVVNANTFESSYTISKLKLPRYFTTLNGKGYVTEWVSFSEPGRVSVLDLSSHAVTDSIVTDYGAENITAVNGKLYVSNNFTNTISVINAADNSVSKTIEVGNSPAGFTVDNQGKLWVICSGGYDVQFNPLNDGQLVQIDPGTDAVIKTVELNMNVSSDLGSDKSKTHLFFFSGNKIYKFNVTDTEAPASPIVSSTSYFYGLGVDPTTDLIYAADAKGFDSGGTVYRYSASGETVDSFTAGIGPNGFVFKH